MSLEQERMTVLRFVYERGPVSIADIRRDLGSPVMRTLGVTLHFSGLLNVDGPRDPDGGWDDEALIQLSPKGVEEVLSDPLPPKPPTGTTTSKKVAKRPKSEAYRRVQAACQLAESRNTDGHTPRWR